MALILNIETATTMCSVAVSQDGRTIALKEINQGYTHAENLTVFIENVLQESGIKMDALQAICISRGPGSYTGLRIGVSVAKGLCYGLNIPLISSGTLQHMAFHEARKNEYGTTSNVLFCPMIDARRMEVYCAIYDVFNKELEPVQAKIIDENSFSELLDENRIVFFGDGAIKCRNILSHKNAEYIEDQNPSAANMGELAEKEFNKGSFENLAYFEPFYLKDFVAGKKKQDQ